jgi:energy-coupling factor transport system ATP-binding protein
MNEGKVFADGSVDEVFSMGKELCKIGLNVPQIQILMNELSARGLDINSNVYTVEAAKKELISYFNRIKGGKENA